MNPPIHIAPVTPLCLVLNPNNLLEEWRRLRECLNTLKEDVTIPTHRNYYAFLPECSGPYGAYVPRIPHGRVRDAGFGVKSWLDEPYLLSRLPPSEEIPNRWYRQPQNRMAQLGGKIQSYNQNRYAGVQVHKQTSCTLLIPLDLMSWLRNKPGPFMVLPRTN